MVWGRFKGGKRFKVDYRTRTIFFKTPPTPLALPRIVPKRPFIPFIKKPIIIPTLKELFKVPKFFARQEPIVRKQAGETYISQPKVVYAEEREEPYESVYGDLTPTIKPAVEETEVIEDADEDEDDIEEAEETEEETED